MSLFKKIPNVVYTFVSLVAVAAINYSIVHNSFVFIALFVLLVHELGHYFTAKRHRGNPSLPIFIPIPFLAIALTKVSKLDTKGIKETAFYGPFAGAVATVLIILINTILNFISNYYLFGLLFGEIVFNFFGSDGSKYRKAKKKEKLCLSY